MVDKDRLIEDFDLKAFGGIGWLSSKDLVCPSCGKDKKVGIKINDSGNGTINCMRCKSTMNIHTWLKSLGRGDLIIYGDDYSIGDMSISYVGEEEQEEDSGDLDEIKIPVGLVEIKDDPYLNGRRWMPMHYDIYKPMIGKSAISGKLRGYYVFQIYQDNKLVAWLSRSTRDKEWHKQNEKEAKAGKERLVLRYNNVQGVDFGKVLGGSDRLSEATETIIIVEGMFDSVGVDYLLKLPENGSEVCCFTFGGKISSEQREIIKRKAPNLKRLILMYDAGTMDQMKKYSLEMMEDWDVFVASIESENDPNDMPYEELVEVLNNLKTPMEYFLDKI